jgi:anti-sigma regulatory factor (Ser/Thr protein kinase)
VGNESLYYRFDVDGENFTSAGEASVQTKRILRRVGFSPDIIKRVSIAMYEGEINMVIHANGGKITVTISMDEITMVLADRGPGIPDIDKALQPGYSTAPEDVRSLGFGAGMGLPNMKKYTDEIHITTELGVGTTVTMKVKLA